MNSTFTLPADKQIYVLRIIVGAMAFGVMVFAAIVNFVVGPAGGAEAESGLMTTIGLAVGFIALITHRLIGALMLSSGIKSLPADEQAARSQMMAAKQQSTIAACAILEGAAMLNIIVFGFLDGQPISMAMSALLWLAILLKFPLPGALENWMDGELRAARENLAAKG